MYKDYERYRNLKTIVLGDGFVSNFFVFAYPLLYYASDFFIFSIYVYLKLGSHPNLLFTRSI